MQSVTFHDVLSENGEEGTLAFVDMAHTALKVTLPSSSTLFFLL